MPPQTPQQPSVVDQLQAWLAQGPFSNHQPGSLTASTPAIVVAPTTPAESPDDDDEVATTPTVDVKAIKQE